MGNDEETVGEDIFGHADTKQPAGELDDIFGLRAAEPEPQEPPPANETKPQGKQQRRVTADEIPDPDIFGFAANADEQSQTGAIPAALRERPRWLCWREEKRNGKPTKVPYCATTGKHADCTDASSWTDFETVLEASADYDGIGFVLGDGWVGVDIDHCRDPKTGKLIDEAQQIVDALDSYTEISPSGTGLHTLAQGKLPPGRRKQGDLEMYDSGRYFTVTGNHLPRTPKTVEERTNALATLHKQTFPAAKEQASAQNTGPAKPHSLSDSELLQRMFAAKNGPAVQKLWDGNTSGHRSPSEATLALLGHLAFYTGPDPQRIDALFRESGLMRPKWDSKRGDTTWGQQQIDTALAGRTEFYTPGRSPADEAANRASQDAAAPYSKASVLEMCQDGETSKIVCPRLGEYLHSQAPVLSLAGSLYQYQNGVYRPGGEESIRQDVAEIAGEMHRQYYGNEVVGYLRDKYSISTDDIDADSKILNVANGLLNVDTLELKPHDPQYLSITQVPVEFHTEAQCPTIDKFFSEVFPADCIGLAYELTGYCLRRDLEPRTATLLLGQTHAGKSTFLSLLTFLLGVANVVNIELQDFAEDRFATAELLGKMINTFADIPSRPLKSSSAFKALTGGDRLSAQEKYGRRFDFKPTTKLIFSANQPPGTRDYSDAYYVRWCVIPFNNQFLDAAEDTDLIAKLTTKEELEGLLVAALKAARTIPATGRLSEPSSVQQAKAMFREATDVVATFVRDVCEVGPDEQVGRQRLFQAYYKPWCENNNFRSLSLRTFNERLEKVVPGIHRTTPRDASGKQVKSWSGIGIGDKNNDWPEGAKTDLFE